MVQPVGTKIKNKGTAIFVEKQAKGQIIKALVLEHDLIIVLHKIYILLMSNRDPLR